MWHTCREPNETGLTIRVLTDYLVILPPPFPGRAHLEPGTGTGLRWWLINTPFELCYSLDKGVDLTQFSGPLTQLPTTSTVVPFVFFEGSGFLPTFTVRVVSRSIPPRWRVNSISFGSPHVRCTPMWALSTCGA